MTYSIVGYDHATGEFGLAVATKFLAVGSGVPWVNEHGAVAVQAVAHPPNGRMAQALLAAGEHPESIIGKLTDLELDADAATRQLGIVDCRGRAATFTGRRNGEWAGGIAGVGCAAQGNMLSNGSCVPAMVEYFRGNSSQWLPLRLANALLAGERAGGDSRGRQSAALMVYRPGSSQPIYNYRNVDLRVDDHSNPCLELIRLLGVYLRIFGETESDDYLPWSVEIISEVQVLLSAIGEYAGICDGQLTVPTLAALQSFCYKENFFFRRAQRTPEGKVDPVVVARLRELAFPNSNTSDLQGDYGY